MACGRAQGGHVATCASKGLIGRGKRGGGEAGGAALEVHVHGGALGGRGSRRDMARAASTRRRPLGEVSVQQRAVETAPSKRTAAGVSAAAAESRAAKVRSLTEELEAQVESRCAKLMEVAEDAVVALRAEYRVQLMKLPKKVRSMPLAEFRKEFGESIDAAMLSDIDRRIAAATAAGSGQQASGSGKKRKADASADSECEPADKVPCTPSAQGAKGAAPGTVSRMPRQGEELVSANGSPLGVFLEGGVTPAVGMKTMVR